MIGIAPARNKYNEGLLYLLEETLEEIGEELEYDFIFIVRFWAVILLLLAALFSFRYMNKILDCCDREAEKKKVRI